MAAFGQPQQPIPEFEPPYDPKQEKADDTLRGALAEIAAAGSGVGAVGKVQEQLDKRDEELKGYRAQTTMLLCQMLRISKDAMDAVRMPFRTLEAADARDPQVDLAIRTLWGECEWLMQDMAKLYGERAYVPELPPVKASLKMQLRTERV